MEPSELRSVGTEEIGTGSVRKPTHDFLSLYSHSTAQQDPRSPSQGSYLKTQDFLRPLERVEMKASAKEEATYEISSYFLDNQRVPKPEASLFNVSQATSTDRNDATSNCSSYTSGGFTLWEESAIKKEKTRKENSVGEKPILGVSAARLGQWTLTEQTLQSLSDNHHSSNSFCSSQATRQKNKSFTEMMKSDKDCSLDEELDNEEALILNRESSNTQRAELRMKVERKDTDQKPNTPRSKHSATEQRRRSKINDRFRMLRELIPRSEQKGDKASFLLEVIEYIQFLQEKVHKYEESFQGWNHEPERLIPWRKNYRPQESFESRGTNSGSGPSPTLLFASSIDEKNITVSPTTPGGSQNEESGLRTPITTTSQPNFFTPTQIGGQGSVVSQLTHRLTSDAENTIYQPSEQCQTCTCSTEVAAASDKLKEKNLNIEGGAVSISSVYSKGLLDTLTQVLQSSGVNMSQASLSVQIELGKQASVRPTIPMCGMKDEVPSSNRGMMHSRVPSSEKSDQTVKRLKTFGS